MPRPHRDVVREAAACSVRPLVLELVAQRHEQAGGYALYGHKAMPHSVRLACVSPCVLHMRTAMPRRTIHAYYLADSFADYTC